MKNLIILFVAIVMAGCSNDSKSAEKKPAPASSSTINTVIEGLTGKTAVDAGQNAKQKIRQISAQENKQINEVLNDK